MTAAWAFNSVSIYGSLRGGLKGFALVGQTSRKSIFLRTEQIPFKDLKTQVTLDH